MSELMNQSVKNFIKELKARINILKSDTTRANLNEENYQRLNRLINSSTNGRPKSLTTTDIIKFNVKDIKEILTIIGLDDATLRKIINAFSKNVETFNTTYDQKELLEVTRYFEDIRKMIENYLQEYHAINNAQNTTFEKKNEEYQKYIDILESKQFEELFTDFNSLMKLMNKLAIPSEDKWQILEYIAAKNIAFEKRTIVDINLAKRVYDIVSKYLTEENELVVLVRKYISETDVDIDLIPHIASQIATKASLNDQTVKNVICALVVNSLFDYYLRSVENDEPLDVIDSARQMIEDVLVFYVKEENAIIKKARLILEETMDFYNKHKTEDEQDIMKYLDLAISEIESNEITRDMAIDLKTLPIIKTISETLNKIDNLFDESEDYELCCGILNELITAYNNLLMKKQQAGVNRIK